MYSAWILHSDRGRKSEVYRQLNSTVHDNRARLAVSVSIDELVARRDRLNRSSAPASRSDTSRWESRSTKCKASSHNASVTCPDLRRFDPPLAARS